MTPEEIDKLETGPETNALVAEKVMGWSNLTTKYGCLTGNHPDTEASLLPYGHTSVPEYSTFISAVWEVVDKLKREYDFNMDWDIRVGWNCAWGFPESAMKASVSACADTAPLAICRAALKAKL